MRERALYIVAALALGGGLSCDSIVEAGPTWRTLAALPESRENAAAVEAPDGKLYVYGGRASLLSYSPAEDRWVERVVECDSREPSIRLNAFGPEERSGGRCTPGTQGPYPGVPSAVTDLRGRPLWLSYDGGHVFDAVENRWIGLRRARFVERITAYEGPVPRFQRERAGYARAPDGRIYVVGGTVEREGPRNMRSLSGESYVSPDSRGAQATSASVEVFDPASGSWTSISPMRVPRQSPLAVFGSDGRLYVFGGRFRRQSYNTNDSDPLTRRRAEERAYEESIGLGPDPVLQSVEVYDPSSGEWSLRRPMPRAREKTTAVLGADRRIWVLGCPVVWDQGYGQEGCVFVYDPESDSWENGPQLRKPRHSIAAVATKGGRIYAIGGSTLRSRITLRSLLRLRSEEAGEAQSDVEVLELPPRAPRPRDAGALAAAEKNERSVQALARRKEPLDRVALYELELKVSRHDSGALPSLTRALSSPDWTARRSALRALARMGATARPAEAEIAALLADELVWVRRQALETLVAIGGDTRAAIPMLVTQLRSRDFDDRVRASVALGRVGADALPALEAELRDPNHPYPSDCVEAMREIGPPAVLALGRAAASADRQVRVSAFFGLAEIRTPSAQVVTIAGDSLEHSNDRILDFLEVYALSHLGPTGEERVFRALRDPRGHVELSAAWALADADPGSARVRAALEARLRALRSNDGERRKAYEAAIAKLTPASAPAPPAAISPAASP